jgi:hypothetical protein
LSEVAATRVGAIGSSHQAVVDAHGSIVPDASGWRLDWWIGADDRWHVPGREIGARQRLVDAAPVVETAVRVPGGDAVQRIYGFGGPGDLLAVEIENASPAPFVVALVARPAGPDGRIRSLALNGPWVVVDGRPVVRTVHRPGRWAISRDGQPFEAVAGGVATDGPFPMTRDRAGRLGAAFLHPVSHRTSLRAVVALGPDAAIASESSDPVSQPSASHAAHGWRVHLDRGMRVHVPDIRFQDAIDASRASLLLSATERLRPTPAKLVALEDWGFDAEAIHVWKRLGALDRSRASRRTPAAAPWFEVRARLDVATPTFAWSDGPAPFLGAVRDLLMREHDDDSVELLTDLPRDWIGQPLEVHDAPTRRGSVSYAIRWHGERPALLWDCPGALRVRCPGLDPTWSTLDRRGETLLEFPAGLTRD